MQDDHCVKQAVFMVCIFQIKIETFDIHHVKNISSESEHNGNQMS